MFKKKDPAKPKVEVASAPEEPETVGETKHIDGLDTPEVVSTPAPAQAPTNKEIIREVPVCLSQNQVNNMVIENNFMLKELLLIANQE